MPEVCDLTPGGHDMTRWQMNLFICTRIKIYGREVARSDRGRGQQGGGAAEGRSDDWGEVVTR